MWFKSVILNGKWWFARGVIVMKKTSVEIIEDGSTLLVTEAAPTAQPMEALEQQIEKKRGLLARFLIFMGTYLMIAVLFCLLISPVVIGYVWFFHDLNWSLHFFDVNTFHPPHYYKILKSSAIGCLLYSIFVAWRILKFLRPRLFLIAVLFGGSFVCSAFVCSLLYDKGYF
jgi:uncharacterized membrane protein HdeD (DUF308 family)